MYDLYVRYIPLKSFTKLIILQILLLRVLPPIILKDLFNKFALKTSIVILNLPLIIPDLFSPPLPQ